MRVVKPEWAVIKSAIKKLKIKQEVMASHIWISSSQISRIVNNKWTTDVTLQKIMRYLNKDFEIDWVVYNLKHKYELKDLIKND